MIAREAYQGLPGDTVKESSPTRAELAYLDDDERSLYAALTADVYGPQLRLEQEHIRQGWVLDTLHAQ